jgi:cell division protein FtsA
VAGIVVTGGGAQLQHIKQLVEYVTGIDTRIGLPGEHLASGMVDEVNFPMYATGTGLVIMGLDSVDYLQRPIQKDFQQLKQMSTEARMEARQEARGASRIQTPVSQDEQEFPKISFIERVKTWFENTLSNTGDFIE